MLQTVEEVKDEYNKGTILKAVVDGNIIGSVRGFVDSNTLYIGKLIVHPDYQGKGIGKKLLSQIEQSFEVSRFELFTSSKSTRNISLYEHAGYSMFKEENLTKDIRLVYFVKNK